MSSLRVHPLNKLITRSCQLLPILSLGYSAVTIVNVVPLVSCYVMFLHSNVSWDFGPLHWILVSPAYHRWHHTSDEEGVDKNFAGIFPIWDVLFGTAYFPRALPRGYGLKGQEMPESLVAHLVFPCSRTPREIRSTSADTSASSASLMESGDSHEDILCRSRES